MVRLKGNRANKKSSFKKHFNSNMVRLKDPDLFIKENAVGIFQFQHGTIKSQF